MSCGGVGGMSWTQYYIGPIARTVKDTKTVLKVLAGYFDERDNVTAHTVVRELADGSSLELLHSNSNDLQIQSLFGSVDILYQSYSRRGIRSCLILCKPP